MLTNPAPCGELALERKYRPDIDGLRAIAVGAVVLFHLKFAGFDGGYVGVDIFFVISGYLITGHILRDIAQQDFSFAEFYARRARRILPPLIATVMLTVFAGALWLPPEFLRQLAKEATHGLLSISNVQYWREAKQYFAPASEQLGLLHLWSLSLEEQFYLFDPLVLVLLSRTRHVMPGIAVAGLVSLIMAVVWLPRDPDAVFFLTPFRVFEFAIGALALPLEQHLWAWARGRAAIASAGYLVLLVSIFASGPLQAYAGLGALPACLAAAAIIAANKPVGLLANGLVLGVGRASYSLYLVHWPVIFFTRFIFGASAGTAAGIAAQLAVMGLSTWLLHVVVEQPLRRLQAPRWRQGLGFATAVAACVAVTFAVFRADGARWRLPAPQLARLDLQSFGMNPCRPTDETHCMFGDSNGRRSLELLGDSYVQQYVAALDEPLRTSGIRGAASTVSGCPMLIGVTLPGPRAKQCADLRDSELARIKASPADFVVIGQAWQVYLDPAAGADKPTQSRLVQDGLSATIGFLDRPGRRFLVIGGQVRPTDCAFDRMRMQPGPLWHAPPTPCEPVPKRDAIAATIATDEILGAALRQHAGAELLRPSEIFCDESCPIVNDGVWLFLDAGHFTVAGSQHMGRRARGIIDRFLSSGG
jgi:peptidoglycan/LPS O-acetylase OafA/YrhL